MGFANYAVVLMPEALVLRLQAVKVMDFARFTDVGVYERAIVMMMPPGTAYSCSCNVERALLLMRSRMNVVEDQA